MSNRVHLHCDGIIIGLGGQSLAPCGRQLAATSRYVSATELRKAAKERGWKTGRQRINAPFRRHQIHWKTNERLEDFEGVRTWTEPVDLCPEHAGQMKQLTREKTLPLHDTTPEAKGA